MKALETSLWILYGLLWLGGIANYTLFDSPSPAAAWAGPLFLWCAFAIALLPASPALRRWLLLAALGGFLAELLGLHTGILFGSYHYGEALGPKLLGVPLSIAAAWGVLMAGAASLASPGKRLLGAIPVSLWMVCADLLIDPLASGPLGYWQWPAGGPYYGVPLHNFLGWFIVSLLPALLLPRRTVVPRRSVMAALSILGFYGIIALSIPGMWPLSLVALCLLLLSFRNWSRGNPVSGTL
ncbi:MAG: carotenoid biosynthesis protein [Planctomycetales bacterium]|nr:carotenoid biosynthesis protein [bacterium]UNM06986.1 MAG: carotenoid biosynthesis protein [Planctomycetales bacterium]